MKIHLFFTFIKIFRVVLLLNWFKYFMKDNQDIYIWTFNVIQM